MSNPLYDLMYRGESGAQGYNAYNRGTYTDANGRERIRPGSSPMDFSQFTLGEIQEMQHRERRDPDRVFAIGKYQIIPGTMDAAVAKLRLDPNAPFSPELQDRIFSEYLMRDKQPAVRDYIEGRAGATLERAQHGLAREWASFGDPYKDGRSYHGGANQAHIGLDESAAALRQMRQQYQEAIDRGASRQDAWRAATAIDPEQRDRVPSRPSPGGRDAMADGVLKQDERGPAVRELQEALNQLGVRDASGNPLQADGHFGQRTREAVEAFQRSQGLDVDGKAGLATLGAIKQAQQQAQPDRAQGPLLSDPANPDNALYRQALDGLSKLGAAGYADERQRQNAAATMVYEARMSGLTQIDHIVPNRSGTGFFAVQGEVTDPASQRVYVDKAQAAGQSVEQSTAQLRQDAPQRQQEQQPQLPKTIMV